MVLFSNNFVATHIAQIFSNKVATSENEILGKSRFLANFPKEIKCCKIQRNITKKQALIR